MPLARSRRSAISAWTHCRRSSTCWAAAPSPIIRPIPIQNVASGNTAEIALDGLFLAVGLVPQNEAFADVIALNERGYASADESCTTETKGIFVAGDCRTKRIRQVTTAAADGALAALAACDYIDTL